MRTNVLVGALACLSLTVVLTLALGLGPQDARRPLVLAHRGASGHLPEHTLAAYTLAWSMGADYIEPDVVLTGDGVAICAHDVHMERVTDVAKRFPDRARDDGRFYWIDFTAEEVRTLRVTVRGSGDQSAGATGGSVPTFEEFLTLIDRLNAIEGPAARSRVGVIPEPKRPGFHRQAGLDVESAVLDALARHGYATPGDPAIVQCFELDALARIHERGARLRLVWLLGETPEPGDLERAAAFCHGVGPKRALLEDEATGEPLPLLARARTLGLAVYPYTFRNEPGTNQGEALARFARVHRVDGVFTDDPDLARHIFDAP